MGDALTPRDRKVLSFLRSHVETHGVLPPQYQVAIELGLSPNSTDVVRGCFAALEREGLIRRFGHRRWSNFKLVNPEDDNAPDGARSLTPDAIYEHHSLIVQALKGVPPIGLAHKFKGLLPLSVEAKADWFKRATLSVFADRSAAR